MFLYVQSPVACDDGYIDCRLLGVSRRSSPDVGKKTAERRESEPLLGKSTMPCMENSEEDLTDGAAVTMYRCLSRSCSVGSQLSAAASSTLHEESINDLTLEASSPNNEYLPMSRITVPEDDAPMAASAAEHGSSEKSPLLGTFCRGEVAEVSVSKSLSPSSSRATNPAAVPPSVSYRNTKDEDGYLLFHPTTVSSASNDQGSGGSLERLGPPPEIPTSAATADYIVPVLPPKTRTSAGLRTHSLLLNNRPRLADRRGSADAWCATSSPARENPDMTLASISTASSGISHRPASERRASRKPNLTVDAAASADVGELLIISQKILTRLDAPG